MRVVSVADTEGGALRVTEADTPTPGPEEVVITVAGAGVNRADVLQRKGLYPSPSGWPSWPGLECAGIIGATGADVTAWKVGDRVCALVGGGAYAERVAAPADLVLPVPAGVTLVEAAGLMEAASTVWSNLTQARAEARETLLIHGGSGGIGTFAIQLAKSMGLTVITTARGKSRAERCRALGADIAVDYAEDDFVEQALRVGGADVILDVVGAAYLERNIAALSTGGRLMVIGLQRGADARIDLRALMGKRASVVGTTLRSRPHAERAAIVAGVLRDVWPLIPDRVRPVIHSTVPFERAQAAHDLLDSGQVFGKLVLVP